MHGVVVKLDRSFPLVRLDDGHTLRCEAATQLVKQGEVRPVIGDDVDVLVPEGHDMGVIAAVLPRTTQLVRRDPRERTDAQVMAANFQTVFVVQPLDRFNERRLERELVLAFETGARVAVLLTKADLVGAAAAYARAEAVRALVGPEVPVVVLGAPAADARADAADGPDAAVEAVRALVPAGQVGVLMGQSGAGKSTLINRMVGAASQATGAVREGDGKGRHTTVSRQMVPVPGGGFVVDMPGVRGLGLWDAERGIARAFADVAALADACQFRDCAHGAEPGCAVQEAVAEGDLSAVRVAAYVGLLAELADTRARVQQQSWRN